MPYIDQKHRKALDESIDALISRMGWTVAVDKIGRDGILNYVVTRLLMGRLGPMPRYSDLNEVMGVLECAKLELYRRMAAPYEDKKREENGDVY